MVNKINLRELVLGILLEINKEGQHSHLVIRSTLEKYQYQMCIRDRYQPIIQ